jgi:hypothetical protein
VFYRAGEHNASLPAQTGLPARPGRPPSSGGRDVPVRLPMPGRAAGVAVRCDDAAVLVAGACRSSRRAARETRHFAYRWYTDTNSRTASGTATSHTSSAITRKPFTGVSAGLSALARPLLPLV